MANKRHCPNNSTIMVDPDEDIDAVILGCFPNCQD